MTHKIEPTALADFEYYAVGAYLRLNNREEVDIARQNMNEKRFNNIKDRAMKLYGSTFEYATFLRKCSFEELCALYYALVYNSLFYKRSELNETHRSMITSKLMTELNFTRPTIKTLQSIVDRVDPATRLKGVTTA